ncbi:hypothetical protein [Glycomyces harbinensis]|uniref:hypothetical protein n=1 Tax=Glycomyces harbinensis TaxID=58114 RepID=UPI001C40B619|nr:hypothetical protein [Glycomyces harbinensis]
MKKNHRRSLPGSNALAGLGWLTVDVQARSKEAAREWWVVGQGCVADPGAVWVGVRAGGDEVVMGGAGSEAVAR